MKYLNNSIIVEFETEFLTDFSGVCIPEEKKNISSRKIFINEVFVRL